MRTIWKYTVPRADEFALVMPAPATIIAVQMQHDRPTIWAIVDSSENVPQITRRLVVVGTGHRLPDNARHLGTYQEDGGMFVWHLFEVG